MTRRGLLLFITLGLIWGIPYLFIKVAVTELTPEMLVLSRSLLAALILLPLAAYRRELAPVLRRWRPLAAFAVVGAIAEARSIFTRAGDLGLIDAWRNLGILEANAGDANAACIAYSNALAINGDDAPSHAGLSQAYELMHQLDLARGMPAKPLNLIRTMRLPR